MKLSVVIPTLGGIELEDTIDEQNLTIKILKDSSPHG